MADTPAKPKKKVLPSPRAAVVGTPKRLFHVHPALLTLVRCGLQAGAKRKLPKPKGPPAAAAARPPVPSAEAQVQTELDGPTLTEHLRQSHRLQRGFKKIRENIYKRTNKKEENERTEERKKRRKKEKKKERRKEKTKEGGGVRNG